MIVQGGPAATNVSNFININTSNHLVDHREDGVVLIGKENSVSSPSQKLLYEFQRLDLSKSGLDISAKKS